MVFYDKKLNVYATAIINQNIDDAMKVERSQGKYLFHVDHNFEDNKFVIVISQFNVWSEGYNFNCAEGNMHCFNGYVHFVLIPFN